MQRRPRHLHSIRLSADAHLPRISFYTAVSRTKHASFFVFHFSASCCMILIFPNVKNKVYRSCKLYRFYTFTSPIYYTVSLYNIVLCFMQFLCFIQFLCSIQFFHTTWFLYFIHSFITYSSFILSNNRPLVYTFGFLFFT